MVGLYIDCTLGASTFAAKATHTHLVLGNLTFHFILNSLDALTMSGFFAENTDFQRFASNFSLKLQKQSSVLGQDIYFAKSSVAKIMIDIAKRLEQFIEFFCNRSGDLANAPL